MPSSKKKKSKQKKAANANVAAAAIDSGAFATGITPITVNEVYLDENEQRQERQHVIDTDEGVRRGTNAEALAKLRPVFAEESAMPGREGSAASPSSAKLHRNPKAVPCTCGRPLGSPHDTASYL